MTESIKDWAWKTVEAQWDTIMFHKGWAVPLILLAFIGGATVSYFFLKQQIETAHEARDIYKDCLSTGALSVQCNELSKKIPKPSAEIKYVDRIVLAPLPTPEKDVQIDNLYRQLTEAQKDLEQARSDLSIKQGKKKELPKSNQGKSETKTDAPDCSGKGSRINNLTILNSGTGIVMDDSPNCTTFNGVKMDNVGTGMQINKAPNSNKN